MQAPAFMAKAVVEFLEQLGVHLADLGPRGKADLPDQVGPVGEIQARQRLSVSSMGM